MLVEMASMKSASEITKMTLFELDYKRPLKTNNLLLPKQPNNNDFLHVMANMFKCACIIGVFGSRRYISYIWTACVLGVLMFVEGHAVWKVIKALTGLAIDMAGHRSVAARFAGTIFYTISIACLILVSKLFYSWPEVAAAWIKVERMTAVKIPEDRTLKKRMYIVACVWLILGLIEHVMSIISLIGFNCPRDLILKKYVMLSHGFMILKHEYSESYAFPLIIINCIATLLWNFQDVLIVLISIGLTSRYSRLNQFLAGICAADKKQIEYNKKSESVKLYTWRKLREAYVKQAFLVRKVDSALGGIIVLSCMCNFYFICLQLFMGITQGPISTPIKKAYYALSLSWLCVRVTSVILAASDINIQSRSALRHIYAYDTHGYNVEVDRLQDQLSKDYVALSGMGFFYLNKNILLQMVGAIITYELVLIQFDDKRPDNSDNIQLNITSF